MNKSKKIGARSKVQIQSLTTNLQFCLFTCWRMSRCISCQFIWLILFTSGLILINGHSSAASDITNLTGDNDSFVPSVIVQSPDAPAAPTEEPPSPLERIYIRQIQVIDSTVFDESDFAPVVKPFEGRELTLEETRQVADAITQLYLNENYLNSRAVAVTPQPGMASDVLVIRVIEGRLADIDIQGTQRVNPAYIRSRIQLGAGVPLNAVKLEEQLRLLRLDPLFDNIEASLRPTGQVGQSLLVVRVQEARQFTSSFFIDNYSPPSVGGERFGVELNYRNFTGFGDLFTGAYYRTFTGGSQIVDLKYQIPVNAMDGTVQVRFAPGRSKITESLFRDLNIEGEQNVYEINFRQPLWRSPREEFALSLGFTHQNGQTFLFDRLPTPFGIGPDADGVSRTSVIKFAQDYVRRDPQGAWVMRSQFNLGVGLFNATINPDPIPDSRFFSWLGQIQRSQRLSDDHLLLVQADLQLTPDSLLPSQQFVIGGGRSLRGYRQNIRYGDNGFRLSVEDRITVQRNEVGLPTIQLAPFIDMGAVWNQSNNPNQLPSQTFLASTGLGLIWNQALGIENLSLRLDYGFPFINLNNRGNNIQDDGFYFSLRYQP
jgi:hemolysin activation/secretion protein